MAGSRFDAVDRGPLIRTRLPRRRLGRGVTIALVVGILVVIGIVWLFVRSVAGGEPATLDGVRQEAVRSLESVADTVGAADVATTRQDASTESCADGSGGEKYEISRELAVTEEFDRSAWIRSLSDQFRSEGWTTEVDGAEGPDGDAMRLEMVRPSSTTVSVTTDDSAGQPRILIEATSRCSDPEA